MLGCTKPLTSMSIYYVRYQILDILGAGTFGQVVKCQNLMSKQLVGVKVVKNKPAYLKQSLMEVDILKHVRVIEESYH